MADNKDKPFFSLVVACCDVEPYVRACLNSVRGQPFADWECLIGVEASKDRTEKIVREYAAVDSRFKVFAGPRSGSCSASRNTGTDMAQGEYVIFLDGDDTIAEGSLQRLHDKIAARPGADLYPCAIQVHNDITGKDEGLRDNYPADFNGELTGPEAILSTLRHLKDPCPMLQLTVFRRQFLVAENLKCIHGLRRQDSEFTPRALYLAKRVIPLHEPFYLYRIQGGSVSVSGAKAGGFLKDFAVIIRSLLAFHAVHSKDPAFDPRLSSCWARQWLDWLFYFWFDPRNMRKVPRPQRLQTLQMLFENGFGDLEALLPAVSKAKRIACWWVRAFVRRPGLRRVAELFFAVYFPASRLKRPRSAGAAP